MSKRMKPATTTTVIHHSHRDEERVVKRHHHRPQKVEDGYEQPLISGLPDHISHLILSRVPPHHLFPVCTSWRRFIYTPLYPAFPSLYALLTPTTASTTTPIEFAAFDFVSSRWSPLPPSPSAPLRLLLRHPSYISRDFPVQSVSVSGKLVLVAATITPPSSQSDDDDDYQMMMTMNLPLPLPHPLVFCPLTMKWSRGPPLPAPRRWCAVGALSGSAFVASGIGSRFNSDVARSLEKWDITTTTTDRHPSSSSSPPPRWEKLGQMRDGRFSREAIEAIGCGGRLYMVNVKGDAAKEGAVYDARTGTWCEMPEKMIAGWKGPAAAMDEEVIYVVDERRGALRKWWVGRGGEWVDVVEDPNLRGARQITAAKGRVYVVGKEGTVLAVDVAGNNKVCSLDTPPGYTAVAVHVLPRMPIRR